MQASEMPVPTYLHDSPLQRRGSEDFSPPPSQEHHPKKRTYSSVSGSEFDKRQAFRPFRELENRIRIFCSLRLDALGGMAVKREVDRIGKETLNQSAPSEE